MRGSNVTTRLGRVSTVLLALAALQPMESRRAQATDSDFTSGFDALASGWSAATEALVRGWTSMGKAMGRLPAPDLPGSPTLLNTHVPCVDREGRTSNDCSSAVDAVCRKHGFQGGQQIDMESGQVCRITPQGFTTVAHAFACKSKVWLTQAACW